MSIGGAVLSYLKTLGLSLIGQLKVSVVAFLDDFVKHDLGALALDAVEYASTYKGTDIEKRDAAKARFVADLKDAGHDITTFGESTLNFLIETAYQAFLNEQGISFLNK